MWATASVFVPLHLDFFHLDFSHNFPQINKELLFACDEETDLGRTKRHLEIQLGISVQISSFIDYSPLMNLAGPIALPGVSLLFYCDVLVYLVLGFLFSAWRWFFFFGNILLPKLCCCRFLNSANGITYIFCLENEMTYKDIMSQISWACSLKRVPPLYLCAYT
jgi:hypothetical protein